MFIRKMVFIEIRGFEARDKYLEPNLEVNLSMFSLFQPRYFRTKFPCPSALAGETSPCHRSLVKEAGREAME
jgi:hypothetical protein